MRTKSPSWPDYLFTTIAECFEVHYNHKKVYSRRELAKYPNPDEMVEIAYWMNQVKRGFEVRVLGYLVNEVDDFI